MPIKRQQTGNNSTLITDTLLHQHILGTMIKSPTVSRCNRNSRCYRTLPQDQCLGFSSAFMEQWESIILRPHSLPLSLQYWHQLIRDWSTREHWYSSRQGGGTGCCGLGTLLPQRHFIPTRVYGRKAVSHSEPSNHPSQMSLLSLSKLFSSGQIKGLK